VPAAQGLAAAYARVVDPAEFNACTEARNKSDLLFEVVADLVVRVRRDHPGPVKFLVGKHGGRTFYLEDLRRRIDPEARLRRETPRRSTYAISGGTLSFLQDAEDRHELVALASMIGKYVRECAMKLFNDWWSARVDGIRPTAGYGADGARFFEEIERALESTGVDRAAVLRRR
jgi:hypothetical protein